MTTIPFLKSIRGSPKSELTLTSVVSVHEYVFENDSMLEVLAIDGAAGAAGVGGLGLGGGDGGRGGGDGKGGDGGDGDGGE